MKLIKYFFSNNLLIKSLLITRNFNLPVIPTKYYSIKSIKKCYLENNIYFDLYNDLCNNIECNNDECKLYDNINYNNEYLNSESKKINIHYFKYNDLTAEHIFPQSFTKNYKKANKDMHNIYLTKYYTNNLRSNYKFSENLLSSNKSNKIYIPCNNSKGMIARSITYMKYTYPLLNVSYVINYNDLILWNKLYPPSDYEIMKNKVITNYQGNSNIFIENHELLEIFIKKISKNIENHSVE
jgi:hypothetical protein